MQPISNRNRALSYGLRPKTFPTGRVLLDVIPKYSSIGALSSFSPETRSEPMAPFLNILKNLSVVEPYKKGKSKYAESTILSCLPNKDLSAFASTCRSMRQYSIAYCEGRREKTVIDKMAKDLPIDAIIHAVRTKLAPLMKKNSGCEAYLGKDHIVVQKKCGDNINIFVLFSNHKFVFKGGNKTVQLCFDVQQRRVAVLSSFGATSCIDSELEAMDHLKECPHVLTPYEVIRIYDEKWGKLAQVYTISKWCIGGDLYSIHYSRKFFKTLDLKSLKDLEKRCCYELAKALASLHRLGWSHGDVKPENIVLDMDSDIPRAKLIDFGATYRYGHKFSGGGTFLYDSPERRAPGCRKATIVHPSRDIFSLGVIFYEIFFALPPYFKFDKGDLVKMIQSANTAAKMSALFPQLSTKSELSSLISPMLHPDPSRRPPMPEVLNHMNRIFFSS